MPNFFFHFFFTYLLCRKQPQQQWNHEYMMELMIEIVLDQLCPTVVIARFDLPSTLFLIENLCLLLPVQIKRKQKKIFDWYKMHEQNCKLKLQAR